MGIFLPPEDNQQKAMLDGLIDSIENDRDSMEITDIISRANQQAFFGYLGCAEDILLTRNADALMAQKGESFSISLVGDNYEDEDDF